MWTSVFDTWVTSTQAQASNHPSVMLLKVWRVTIGVLLQLEWPPSELSWDAYLSEFVEVVALAADMLGAPASLFNHSPSVFSQGQDEPSSPDSSDTSLPLRTRPWKSPPSIFLVTLGIITPLYMCATRCRDSVTRHQAIALLFYCQRREGLWDSEVAARIATRIVSIEEAAADIEHGTEYTPCDIALSVRVRSLSPKFENDREVRVRYNQDKSPLGVVEEVFTW